MSPDGDGRTRKSSAFPGIFFPRANQNRDKPKGGNMKLRSNPCALIAAGAVALAVAGCGDEPSPKAAAIPPSSPAPAPAPETKPAPVPEKAADADQALAARVKSALNATAGLNAHRIDVTVKNGAVTLFGTTETKEQRETAAKAATAVTGVQSVENRLAVVAGS